MKLQRVTMAINFIAVDSSSFSNHQEQQWQFNYSTLINAYFSLHNFYFSIKILLFIFYTRVAA